MQQVKHSGRPAGDKHTDGGGMYLLVKPGGRYWRLDYSFGGKGKTLALGVYPEVSLAKARKRREKARELLAEGVDPMVAKRMEDEVDTATGSSSSAGRCFDLRSCQVWPSGTSQPTCGKRWRQRRQGISRRSRSPGTPAR